LLRIRAVYRLRCAGIKAGDVEVPGRWVGVDREFVPAP
jgi:hypothetical protein